MKRFAHIALLALMLCSCAPHRQLARLLARHPELHRDSTVVLHDTVVIAAEHESEFIPYAFVDSLRTVAHTAQADAQKSSTAMSVVAGRATALLSVDSAGLWLTAVQRADTVHIEVTKEVPVYFTRKEVVQAPITRWQRFKMRMGVLFIVLLCCLTAYQAARIIYKLKL